ncbi:MAG TPA: carbonic anhydrase [Xanthobacteraceae bacterium]|nr:carbonic anhydrase [Xanthobacteraceae bacterium]
MRTEAATSREQKAGRAMCVACDKFAPDRRKFLSLSALSIAATGFVSMRFAFAADATTNVTADEAIARLKAGNEKYVSAPQVCAVDLAKQREQVAKAQMPWATIIACSDSRVPPELLFGGLGLGELFVARNAGNMADTATMGTIEYGAEHLGIPLIVVMGHQGCGAVAAACAVVEKHAKFPGSIGPMVNAIVPAAKAVYRKPGDFVDNTVRESAKRTATKIATKSKIVSHLIKANKVKVLAARYDLDDGHVEFLA